MALARSHAAGQPNATSDAATEQQVAKLSAQNKAQAREIADLTAQVAAKNQRSQITINIINKAADENIAIGKDSIARRDRLITQLEGELEAARRTIADHEHKLNKAFDDNDSLYREGSQTRQAFATLRYQVDKGKFPLHAKPLSGKELDEAIQQQLRSRQ